MMKKVWLVLLAVVLVFGLAMFGCSSGGGDEGEGEGEGEGQGQKYVFDGDFKYELWGNNKPVYDEATGLLTFDKVTDSMGFIINFADIKYTYNAKDKLIFTYYVEVETPAAALLVKSSSKAGDLSGAPGSSGGAGYGQGKAWEYVLGDAALSVHTGPLVDGTWDPATKTGTIEVLMGLFKSSITGIGFQHNTWCDMGSPNKELIADNSKYKLKFTKVENAVSTVDTTPSTPAEGEGYDDTIGLTEGIGKQGSATINPETGEIALGEGLHGDSSLFTIDLPRPTSKASDKTIIIKYICKEVEPAAKLTLKDVSKGAWNDMPTAHNSDGCNWYLDLKTDEKATIELKERWYDDGTDIIGFQSNDWQNEECEFYIKIISVTME